MPAMPAPAHVEAAKSILLTTIITFGLLALASIGTGAFALYKSATGDSTFNIWGVKWNTTNVGVAMVSVGLIAAMLTVRSVLKTTRELAALPDTGRRRPKKKSL